MDPTKVITTVLTILVVFGVMWMIVRHVTAANALLASGTSLITNTTAALENG